jgi:hypothetical protein
MISRLYMPILLREFCRVVPVPVDFHFDGRLFSSSSSRKSSSSDRAPLNNVSIWFLTLSVTKVSRIQHHLIPQHDGSRKSLNGAQSILPLWIFSIPRNFVSGYLRSDGNSAFVDSMSLVTLVVYFISRHQGLISHIPMGS